MKAKLIMAIFCLGFFLALPQTSEAQLKGLMNKLKKNKKGGSESTTDAVKNAAKGKVTINISDEDVKRSNALAEEFFAMTEGAYNLMDRKETIDLTWLPSEMTKYLDNTSKALKPLGGGDLDKYYEANKADIDKFTKMATQLETTPRANLEVTGGGSYGSEISKVWAKEGVGSSSYSRTGSKALKYYNAINNKKGDYLSFLWNAPKESGSGDGSGGVKVAMDYVIELAYKEQEKSKPDVIKMMAAADQLFSVYKSSLPAGDPILSESATLEKDLKAAVKDIAGDYLANLYVSDFHKANTGKVFFSKKPIDPKTATAASFSNEFTINDEIYAIFYYEATLLDQKIFAKSGKSGTAIFPSFINMRMDGAQTDHLRYYAGDYEAMAKQGYITFGIKPRPEKADNAAITKKFIQVISGKSPRTHSIPFEFKGAKGDLRINLAGMDQAKLKAYGEEVSKKADENAEKASIANRGLPPYFNDAKLYNHSFQPVSMAQVRQLATKRYSQNLAKIDAIVVQDGDYGQTTWDVKVNALGVPISRSGPGYFIAFVGKDGQCYHDFFGIYQKYQGGSYGPTMTSGYSNAGKATKVSYNCAKKKFAR